MKKVAIILLGVVAALCIGFMYHELLTEPTMSGAFLSAAPFAIIGIVAGALIGRIDLPDQTGRP